MFSAVSHDNLKYTFQAAFQPELPGGICLAELPEGACLEVETKNHLYSLKSLGGGKAWICGHPEYCPTPVEVTVAGAGLKGTLRRSDFIDRGMRLAFWHPSHELIATSKIVDIRQVA
jgi:hypothetical protein